MIAAAIQPILLITGLATAGALVLVLAPIKATHLIFGHAPADPVGVSITRHWGLLVGLVGALVVDAAYSPEIRLPTLIVAIVEKAAFAALVVATSLRRRPLALAMALADAGMATLYALYLAGL